MCASAGLHTPAQDFHHVIYAQRLRRYVETIVYQQRLGPGETARLMADTLWDTRNAIGLCRPCHDAAHSRKRPIPYRLLPAAALEYAEEHGFMDALARDYS